MLKILLLIYLLIVTGIDIYKKEIPFRFSLLCIVLAAIIQLVYYQTEVLSLLYGVTIGLLLLGTSMVTKGAVGLGDGMMFLVIGSAIGFSETLTVLAGSLLLASLSAMFFILFFHVGKKYRIPFAPFTCLTYGGMIFFV